MVKIFFARAAAKFWRRRWKKTLRHSRWAMKIFKNFLYFFVNFLQVFFDKFCPKLCVFTSFLANALLTVLAIILVLVYNGVIKCVIGMSKHCSDLLCSLTSICFCLEMVYFLCVIREFKLWKINLNLNPVLHLAYMCM